MTIMDCVLRRWDKRTLDETVIPLCTTYVSCARCGRMAEFHLAERDDLTGEFVHAGGCPVLVANTCANSGTLAEVAATGSQRQPVSVNQTERAVMRIARPDAPKPDPTSVAAVERTVARHAATMRPPIVPQAAPTPEQIRWIHEDALRRAQERAEAARRAAGGAR